MRLAKWTIAWYRVWLKANGYHSPSLHSHIVPLFPQVKILCEMTQMYARWLVWDFAHCFQAVAAILVCLLSKTAKEYPQRCSRVSPGCQRHIWLMLWPLEWVTLFFACWFGVRSLMCCHNLNVIEHLHVCSGRNIVIVRVWLLDMQSTEFWNGKDSLGSGFLGDSKRTHYSIS